MAHWAEIDDDNIVTRVVVTSNNEPDEGKSFVNSLGGRWLKTSYNTMNNQHVLGGIPLRGNFASIGYSYDENLDAFIPPKSFDSWIFSEETISWYAPIPEPEDDTKKYFWDEESVSWIAEELEYLDPNN